MLRDIGGFVVLGIMMYMTLSSVLYVGTRRGRTPEYWQHPKLLDWLYYPWRRQLIRFDELHWTLSIERWHRFISLLVFCFSSFAFINGLWSLVRGESLP